MKQCGLVKSELVNLSSNEFSSTRPVEQRLRLNEFKTLQKAWSRGIPWWDHLVFALLWWLEEKLINYRVKTAVDEAVKEVEMPPMPDMVTPVYRETPSATSASPRAGSVSFPELRLTAPWYVPPDNKPKGR